MTMTVWTPESGTGPGMLLIQEIFGVGPYIRAVGERLADGRLRRRRAGPVLALRPRLRRRPRRGRPRRVDAAGRQPRPGQGGVRLRDRPRAAGRPGRRRRPAPGVIGFCLGGTLAFGVAAADDPAVCVSYYGSGVPGDGRPARCGELPDAVPLRGRGRLHPGRGGRGPRRGGAAEERARSMVVNVEAAGHAFDNHEAAMFYDEGAAKAAWAKTMAFLGEHHPGVAHPSTPSGADARAFGVAARQRDGQHRTDDERSLEEAGGRAAAGLRRGQAEVLVGRRHGDAAAGRAGDADPAG